MDVAKGAGWFDRMASGLGRLMSNPYSFALVFLAVLSWTIAGFFLGFADAWLSGMHLVGPVVTLLLVFLLQHGQAKNTRAIQLKLDELIASHRGASKGAMRAERKPTERLEMLEASQDERANNLQEASRGAPRRRKADAHSNGRRSTHRDPRQRRRRPVARARPRTARPRGQDW